MNSRTFSNCILSLFLICLCLSGTGCGFSLTSSPVCNVIFEDNPSLFFYRQTYEVSRGNDLSVSIGVPHQYRISSVNHESYSLSGITGTSASYDYYTLTLHEILYPSLIRLTISPAGTVICHTGNGADDTITITSNGAHRYSNAPAYSSSIAKDGFLPIGWNTAPDGTGSSVGFGSRVWADTETKLHLYPHWLKCTPKTAFSYTISADQVTITGYQGKGDLVIPEQIEGKPVTALAAGAFGDIKADTVALPPTITSIEPGAFRSLAAGHLYLFDSLESVTDASFGSYRIAKLHINAVLPPVYSGTYFDTLSDKIDYLQSVQNENKLVLFCGSSARFGYDSPMLEAAFPEYKVVNLGVYAYSNMLPLARIAGQFMKSGDILLSSPELDAIDMQFCSRSALDKETFCMMESCYDMLSLLDLTEFTNVFDAFSEYQNSRRTMTPRSYSDSASFYDEDGTRTEQPSYNSYGDYILYRENNTAGKNFGIKRAFYNAVHITEADWNGLNSLYDFFTQKGVTVYFTYSPRSKTSISEDSTPDARKELELLFRQKLPVPVISSLEDSLMEPLYFFGTDNHLSTEGVQIHTKKVIEYLRRAMEDTP